MAGRLAPALALALAALHGAAARRASAEEAARPDPLFEAASRSKGGRPQTAADPGLARLDVEAEIDKCSRITECYCTKGTSCGWCASTGKAMLGGGTGGPMDSQHCDDFIPWATDCPVLHCSEDGELNWWLHCTWMPGFCFLIWLVTLCFGERLQKVDDIPTVDEALLNSVTFSTGQAVRQASAGGPVQDREEEAKGQAQAVQWGIDFFGTKRTFEAFCKGMDCPADERLPTAVHRPYELNLSDLSVQPGEKYCRSRVGPHRFSATLRVAMRFRSALGAKLAMAAGLMLVSSLYLMFLRNAARHMEKTQYSYLALITKEIGAVVGPLQTAVSMLLSFYALNRIAWFWSVLMEGHTVQGRCHDLAMLAGAIKKDNEQDWRARYMLYRHLMLTLFFGYQPLTPNLRFSGFGPLERCGLLDEDESKILASAHRGPGPVTESWLSSWVEANLEGEIRQQAFHALRELRNSIAVVQALIDQRAPVSFESLLFCVVYFLVLILPFSPAHVQYSNRQAVMESPHIATVFGVFIICAFYLALIHMLRHLQAPFDNIGAPHDALNPIALFNDTERKLRDYLTFPPAPVGAEAGASLKGGFVPRRQSLLAPPAPAAGGSEAKKKK